MKKSELKQLIREVISEQFTGTPYMDSHTSEGWSGDAPATDADAARNFEIVANSLARAAHLVVLNGEQNISELGRALDNYNTFVKHGAKK